MKFTKLDLLTVLISLFLFSSCKNSNTIGLDVDPNSAIQGVLLDTVSITSQTLADTTPVTTYPSGTSSGSSAGLTRYPLGIMTDPVFGTSQSDLAMAVTLPNSSYSFGKSAVIDSVVLVIPYAAALSGVPQSFYGDTTAIYSININQLSDNISRATSFLSNKKYAAGDLLGTFNASFKPNTKVKVTSIVSGGPDTVVTNAPQLRIRLNKDVITSKILSLDSATLSTNLKFSDAFRGLSAKVTKTTGAGGLMFLDFSTANSSVEIYFKRQNATTATSIDTVYAQFPINKASSPVAATVTHVFTKTIKDALAATTPQQRTYLQSMSGLRNQIAFPYLKDLKKTLGSNIIISKAELVVDIENPADSIPFKLPLRLALYRNDIAGQKQQLPDNDPTDPRTAATASSVRFGGFYDSTKKSYTFVVTSYIQDIFAGKTIDYGTYLVPTAVGEFNPFSFASNASRGVIGSPSNGNNRKIRLNIYYVKSK